MNSTQAEIQTEESPVKVPRVTLEFLEFRADEAAAITGISPVYQSALKNRGVLVMDKKRRGFDINGIAFLAALHALGDPKSTKAAAAVAAFAISWRVLRWQEAYRGHHQRVLWWNETEWSKIEAWRAAVAYLRMPGLTEAQLAEEAERVRSTFAGVNGWAIQSTWLRRLVFRDMLRKWPNERPPERYFCTWADQTCSWHDDLNAAFACRTADNPALDRAVSVIDTDAIAEKIIRRLPRAAIDVQIGGRVP
jgi:hypothetical protein